MENAPWLGASDMFNLKMVRLGDLDGSGTIDITYVRSGGVDIYCNESDNGFADRKRVTEFRLSDTLSSVGTIDLLGKGMTCIVWSIVSPASQPVIQYLDITKDKKPHILQKMINNLGKETEIHYAPSTKFYLQDLQEGQS